ncbi:MAG: NUDIX hydrolase [Candidatus Saccharimonadales bacterium]
MGTVQHDSETLAEGQQVFTACAFLWREENGVKQVFLARRASTKKFLPSVWELPGGHIDYGEDMRVGLAREVMEEFGMQTHIGEVVDVFTYLNEVKKSHSIEVIYFAQFTSPLADIQLNPEDHSEYRWFAEDELEQAYVDPKDANDPEIQAIRKGFARLKAEE